MADLLQAMKWLTEGKRIKHEDWDMYESDPLYIHIHENSILSHKGFSGLYLLAKSDGWIEYFEKPHECVEYGYEVKRMPTGGLNMHILNTQDPGIEVQFCPFCGEK